ncbi:hypothetical protein F2P81_011743 [Scophthalmus maximus]|uniref:Uncharacterized protein n=1 Tax=Scophthalmus maximus TaxID=52904 RepID=A0A6A4SZL2_SCOMX|nr:hypothetical protein F2P81_011743 [Scophthalmus maximus]
MSSFLHNVKPDSLSELCFFPRVAHPSPLERPAGVRVWLVRGSVYEEPGVVLFALRGVPEGCDRRRKQVFATMNAQLLLLLALVGPFCAFTRASPTEIPAEFGTGITASVADVGDIVDVTAAATEAAKEEVTDVVTGPPATEPAVASAEEEVTTEATTEGAAPAITVNTEEAVFETHRPSAAATEAPEPLTTEAPAVETAAPTEPAEVETQPEVTAAAKKETEEEVVVEDNPEEEQGSGQVVGIVIGALLAVVIVIAVVIAVVRRMGKYTCFGNFVFKINANITATRLFTVKPADPVVNSSS